MTGETLDADAVPHADRRASTGRWPANTPLPTLNLNRVYIITGPGTCSASESVINSLRGVGVQVYLIGSTTCGKPYGFYPTDNCGTTYFTIQFRGENAAELRRLHRRLLAGQHRGECRHHRCPAARWPTTSQHELGDPTEARIAAALAFRASNNQTCPAAAERRVGSAPVEGVVPTRNEDRSLWVSKPAARINRIVRRDAA